MYVKNYLILSDLLSITTNLYWITKSVILVILIGS